MSPSFRLVYSTEEEVRKRMPLYEYRCESCGIRFEELQSFNDSPLVKCVECGGKVHRVIHAAGIIFKGPGFYVTDNRRSGSESSEGSNSASIGPTPNKDNKDSKEPAKLAEGGEKPSKKD